MPASADYFGKYLCSQVYITDSHLFCIHGYALGFHTFFHNRAFPDDLRFKFGFPDHPLDQSLRAGDIPPLCDIFLVLTDSPLPLTLLNLLINLFTILFQHFCRSASGISSTDMACSTDMPIFFTRFLIADKIASAILSARLFSLRKRAGKMVVRWFCLWGA